MFNFHTYHIDDVPCLLNLAPGELDGWLAERERHPADGQPEDPIIGLSVGLHPWKVDSGWAEAIGIMSLESRHKQVWAIGECGLDKAHPENWTQQQEAFRAQINIAESVEKPMVIHCVRAFDELLAMRRQLTEECRRSGRTPQPWVIHGFRGKPEQARQIMAKGLLLSFGHRYNVATLREVFETSVSACTTTHPSFFLETDDLRLSALQIYEQAAHHLGVDVARLESLCDPFQTIFRHLTI